MAIRPDSLAAWGDVEMAWRDVAIVLVGILLIGAADIRADDGSGGKSTATGAIAGRILDPGGRPVAGAEVWGVVFREKAGSTSTDAGGRFRLAGLKEDKPVDVWAEAPGLARQRREGLHVFAGRDRDMGALTLLPGTRIRGRAVDSQGRPVVGFRIKLDIYRYVLGHTISSDQTEWSIKGDAEGRFVTPTLPTGEIHLLFSSPGKVRTLVQRKAESGVEQLDLGDVKLADEVPIRGMVVDQDGKPAQGVEVYADYDRENVARTDNNGRFTVHAADKDAKLLMVQSNNYFAPKPFDLGPDRSDVKLVVTRVRDPRVGRRPRDG